MGSRWYPREDTGASLVNTPRATAESTGPALFDKPLPAASELNLKAQRHLRSHDEPESHAAGRGQGAQRRYRREQWPRHRFHKPGEGY